MDKEYVSKLLDVISNFKPWGNIIGIKILHYLLQTQYFWGVFCEATFLSHRILLLFNVLIFKPNSILIFICIKFE